MVLKLSFANNIILSCFFFFFVMIELYFVIPEVITQNINLATELAVPTDILLKKQN